MPGSQINCEKVRKDASDGMMDKLASMTDDNDREFQSRRDIYVKTFEEKKKVLTTNMLKPGMRLDRKAASDCTHVARCATRFTPFHNSISDPLSHTQIIHSLDERKLADLSIKKAEGKTNRLALFSSLY